MREVSIDAQINSKISNGKHFFYKNELPNSFPTLSPGEWIVLKNDKNSYMAFGNDFVKTGPKLWIVDSGEYSAEEYIEKALHQAFSKRSELYQGEGKRLVFGQNDYLPGLIIDLYQNIIIIQINTAGIDRYREYVKSIVQKNFADHKVYFLDNEKYREDESLPLFENELPKDGFIEVNDSQIKYKLSLQKIQKIGFYYDHRDNRNKFESYLKKLSTKESCLDLFCYLGSWGLHALRAGVKNITFVDQAALESEVIENTKQFSGEKSVTYIRSDVYKFLDESIRNEIKWDVIICDPPAFCKTIKQKQQAISGYQKLFNKSFKLLSKNSTLVAASCTKYISLDEFTKIVEQQAKDCGRKISLRDIGIQAKDHPIRSLSDSGNYIKYALYNVE